MTKTNSLQDGQIISVPIFDFQNFLFQIVHQNKRGCFCLLTLQNFSFKWDPSEFGNITWVRIPSNRIWTPDILLYNNAVGNFNAQKDETKAVITFEGIVDDKIKCPCS